MGNDVVSVIRCNLKMLPKSVQYCLTVASFLGTDIDSTLLQILMDGLREYNRHSKDQPIDEQPRIAAGPVELMLEEALAEGFILDDSKSEDDSLRYKFAHDRIHQAADSLVTNESARSKLHHDIRGSQSFFGDRDREKMGIFRQSFCSNIFEGCSFKSPIFLRLRFFLRK